MFALYVAWPSPATRAHTHLAADAVAHDYPPKVRAAIARWGRLFCVRPWAVFIVSAAELAALAQARKVPRHRQSGLLHHQARALLLAGLTLVQGAIDLSERVGDRDCRSRAARSGRPRHRAHRPAGRRRADGRLGRRRGVRRADRRRAGLLSALPGRRSICSRTTCCRRCRSTYSWAHVLTACRSPTGCTAGRRDLRAEARRSSSLAWASARCSVR